MSAVLTPSVVTAACASGLDALANLLVYALLGALDEALPPQGQDGLTSSDVGRVEQEVFDLLLSCPLVGRNRAMAIMAHIGPDRALCAIVESDYALLAETPGVGERLAPRICAVLATEAQSLARELGTEIVGFRPTFEVTNEAGVQNTGERPIAGEMVTRLERVAKGHLAKVAYRLVDDETEIHAHSTVSGNLNSNRDWSEETSSAGGWNLVEPEWLPSSYSAWPFGKRHTRRYLKVLGWIKAHEADPTQLRRGWAEMWRRHFSAQKQGTFFVAPADLKHLVTEFGRRGVKAAPKATTK